MTTLSRRQWLALAAGTTVAALPAPAHARRAAAAQDAAARLPNLRRYLHYDVFTDRPHTGNQLAVFMEPAGLATEAMAAMTREMNYSECTYVFPAEAPGTDVRLRIFGRAGNEMPFAGHPVIGSVFALADEGRIAAGRTEFTFGLGIGPTPVTLEWDGPRLRFAWMTQRPPVYGPSMPATPALAAAMGLEAGQLVATLPVQEVSCGSAFFFAPLISRAAVDAVQMNGRELDALFTAAGVARRGIFVFTTEAGPDGATVYSRMVGATGAEDPATGSASGPLGCYLVRHGLVPAAAAGAITSAQGVKMGRPSRVHIRLAVAGQDVTRVEVGGTSVLVGDGRLRAS
ncbi:MAG: PhzF family phenazine biosynthesis protein [Vicinamibacterales bacterium]